MGSESQIFKFIIPVSRLTANELLCFAASLPVALALSETFPRFRILAVLLLLSLARIEVSNTLSIAKLPEFLHKKGLTGYVAAFCHNLVLAPRSSCSLTLHYISGSPMNRRDFAFLFGAATLAPRAVLAQGTNRRFLIGYLSFPTKDNPIAVRYLKDFLNGMRELGHIEGQDFEMVYRFADLHADRLPQLATELVQLKPDVLVGTATLNAVALKKATDIIPIVIGALADPIELGFIETYAHPGRNVTGIMPYVKGLPTKQLEIAREVVPGAARIGLLDDITDPKARPQRQEIEAAGQNLEIQIIAAEVRTAADIGQAYEMLSTANAEVVVVEQSSMLVTARQVIADVAAAKKLPTLYGYKEHVEVGGLLSYGVNLDWCFNREAYYVDKIMIGAKPADLPVEFPPTLELWINLKTAKTLGLKISSSLLVRADKIIE